MALLDETISVSQPGHIPDHQQIAGKLNDLPNVKRDYGAKGDGTSDDTVAIQAAFNAMDSNFGGSIWFPQGCYVIRHTITCTKPMVSIWCPSGGTGSRVGATNSPSGQQAGFEIVAGSTANPWLDGSSAYMFDIGPTSGAAWNGWNVHGLRLRCRFNCNGLRLNQLNQSNFTNLTIEDTWNNSGIGLLLNGAGSDPQYTNFYSLKMHQVYRGVVWAANAPDTCFYGGFIQGNSGVNAAGDGSVGIDLVSNSCRFFGIAVQDFDQCVKVTGSGNIFRPVVVENLVGSTGTAFFHIVSGADNVVELDAGVVSTVTQVIRIDSGADRTIVSNRVDDTLNTDKMLDNGTNTSFQGHERFRSGVVSTNITLDGILTNPTIDSSGGARTITLPLTSNARGRIYHINRNGANNVTIQRSGSDTISGATTKVLASDNAAITLLAATGPGTGVWRVLSAFGTVT